MGIKANYTIKTPTRLAFLEKIGKSKDNFILQQNKGGVFDIIYTFGDDFTHTLAKKLQEFNNVDTGKLIDSMDFTIKRFGTDYTWQFSMNEYYKYLDQGTKGGKFPWDLKYGTPKENPAGKGNVLFQWVKRNNYMLPGKFRTKKQNQLTLAYLIGMKIKKNGRKGNRFFTSTVEDGRISNLSKDLSKALGVDVVIDIKNFVKEIKKK